MKKRLLKAKETENGVSIEMDDTYFSVLKQAITKSFQYGWRSDYDDYYDIIDIEEELLKIK